jgi:hypothetical protein
VHELRHVREFVKRKPRPRHRKLRRRIVAAVLLVGMVDVVGTLLMWSLETDVGDSEIKNLWNAFFFTTVQLLTVSSQMKNPVTTGGQVTDIFLELTAICLVSGIAGAFASFFISPEDQEDVR